MGPVARTLKQSELDALAVELKRDGICVIRQLLCRETLHEWRTAFHKLRREKEALAGGLAPRDEARYYFTLPWESPFADPLIFANDAILGVLQRVLLQSFEMCQLAVDFPVKGSTFQELHRDHNPLFNEDFVTPLYALAVNFPLVDVTTANGPLEVARGTHLLRKDVALAKVESGEIPLESVELELGDVTIRTPLALHRGTPNTTDEPRPMVVMGYVTKWLVTHNVSLTIERRVWDSYPTELKQMLRANVVDELVLKPETYINFKY